MKKPNHDIVKFKENQIVELDLVLELNHKYGLNKNGLAQMVKKSTKTREELNPLKRALDIMELWQIFNSGSQN